MQAMTGLAQKKVELTKEERKVRQLVLCCLEACNVVLRNCMHAICVGERSSIGVASIMQIGRSSREW